MKDEQIIELYNMRDEAAIAETSKSYGKYLMATAFNVLRNKEDSEETVQDGYIKTWNAIPPARPNSLKLFVAKIVRNTAIDRYLKDRAKKRGSGEIELCLDELAEVAADKAVMQNGEAAFTDAAFDEKELIRIINNYLRSKDAASRAMFVLRYWNMYSIAKISLKLGYTQSKIKTTLFRMRAELKDELSKEGINI